MTKDYTKYDFHDKKNNVHYTKLHKNGLAKEIIIYLLKEDIVKRHEINEEKLNEVGKRLRVETEDEFQGFRNDGKIKRYFESELINDKKYYISRGWTKDSIDKLIEYARVKDKNLDIIPSNSQTAYDKKHTVDLDFFNQEDFLLLKTWMGKPYDKTRNCHQETLSRINNDKGPLKKWKYWHQCVGQRLYPNIEQPKPTSNIVNRNSFFKSMLWSKIFPLNTESDGDHWLSFCLNITLDLEEVNDLSFKIALETNNDNPRRPSLLKIRPQPLYISVDDQSINSWESLIGQSVDYIKQHQSDYWEIKKRFTIDKKSTKSSKNLILYGPPGTGKTYKAKALSVQMADSIFYSQDSSNRKGLMNRFKELLHQKRIIVTTFHQSYSYEDFVEGIKPKIENNQVIYDIQLGVFREICQKALDKPDEDFVLIIDEINRGNVAATFGELITLIEKDKRMGQEEEIKVQLPYSKKLFGVPCNIHIIGTMNTADRSVEALDSALRRRFDFQEIGPNTELLNDIEVKGINLKNILEQINKRIEILLDRNHAIGHSYFLKLKNESQEREKNQLFIDILHNNIIPLLQEHFYSDISKIDLVLGPEFVKKRDLTADDIPKLDGEENSINISTKYEIQKVSLEKLEKALSNFKETQNNENS